MALTGRRTFAGFGFGAIQAGLFLYEAYASGAFGQLVVAEVLPDVVTALRAAGGYYTLNVAHADRVEAVTVGPITIENPTQPADCERLIQAVAEADEIATAVPSVNFYASKDPGSLHRILAEGLRRKAALGARRAVVYAAENHNRAAEILHSHVFAEIPDPEREAVSSRVRFLNTVIGKMSGVMVDPREIRSQKLIPVTPESSRAFVVEAFNRILISQIQFDELAEEAHFQRGIAVFEEKSDLLPFEEAKLYGHNAVHALAAYLGAIRGIQRIAEIRNIPDIMAYLRAAFIEESGAALIRKYAGVDPLFTQEGWTRYADDLLDRMTNPFLGDTVERVGRDPARKLGWNDRLIGTMRLAHSQSVQPRRFALGAVAALGKMNPSVLEGDAPLEPLLVPLWQEASPEQKEQAAVLQRVEDARQRLKHWIGSGFQSLEGITLGKE
jgi:mannitol-1-phosphate 5-dehydrogenase